MVYATAMMKTWRQACGCLVHEATHLQWGILEEVFPNPKNYILISRTLKGDLKAKRKASAYSPPMHRYREIFHRCQLDVHVQSLRSRSMHVASGASKLYCFDLKLEQ